jgi:MFS family permease
VTTIVVSKSPAVPPCTAVSSADTASPCAPRDRKWILIATILGSSLAFMDGSVVNVSLPTLQSSFRVTSGSIQWVVQSYVLFSASLLLLGGAIGDRYGRRRTFLWGIVLFALASAACAFSVSLTQLVIARAVQGVGAALLIPQGLSILTASFGLDERSRAIGTWSAWTSVFSALGPVAGGWLMQVWSWRLIFLMNLPIVFVVILLAPKIPESRATHAGSPRRRSIAWEPSSLLQRSLRLLTRYRSRQNSVGEAQRYSGCLSAVWGYWQSSFGLSQSERTQ